ncbi:unnamed protein product [Chondrus crispus]|uniref:Uncharacterized protein n=1 Tax=Chondrus crispus TaxID=2769 RepID=R7QJD9_CHOCR|nr:unnamed protein product [Chondrus crispus]CDF38632.1 unnamed protein product [Chondrus crispus]|eukprot:XP_005718537.1 unnamed protein product [Chondrus crispus]
MELIVELVAKPDLALTCDDGVDDAVEYPKTWAVTCTDEVGGPPRLKRHDRNLSPPDQSVLLTQQVEVNYGRRMVSFSELNDFSTATLVPSSSGRRRSVEQVLIGNKTYLVRLKTMSVSMVKDGPHSVICLRHDSGLGIAGEQTCRGRTWGREDELVSAFMALQISAANYDTAWELFGSWSRGPEQGFTTKVQWISATLGDRSGRFAADTKSVATVNLYFFSGIALLALSLAAGAVVWFLSIQKSSREAVPVQMTIELSRRVLAMSAVTKYNCSMMPLDSPVTMIARRNDVSCHLETTYLDDMEPVSSSIMADEALVLLGGKNRTELTAPPDTSRKQLGRKGRFQNQIGRREPPGSQRERVELRVARLGKCDRTPYGRTDRWKDVSEVKTMSTVRLVALARLERIQFEVN